MIHLMACSQESADVTLQDLEGRPNAKPAKLAKLGVLKRLYLLEMLKALSTPATFPEKYPSPLEKLDVVSIDYMFLANLQG